MGVWIDYATKFCKWLSENHPDCRHWNDLTMEIVEEYFLTLSCKADNTKRLYMQPIAQASRLMRKRYPDCADVIGCVTFSRKPAKPVARVYLKDVVSFADHLKEHAPRLEVSVALQGLAGLRVMEMLRLTWDKVNLEQGLIEVCGEVKNEDSVRVIPVCKRVLEALQRAKALAGEQTAESKNYVALDFEGKPYKDYTVYGRTFTRNRRKWNKNVRWAPKDLRKCILTFAVEEGLHSSLWERYVGHAAQTVTDRFYVPSLTAKTPGESEAQQRALAVLRRQILDHLDKAVSEADPQPEEEPQGVRSLSTFLPQESRGPPDAPIGQGAEWSKVNQISA